MLKSKILAYVGIALGLFIVLYFHFEGISYIYLGVVISLFSLLFLFTKEKDCLDNKINLPKYILPLIYVALYLVCVALLFVSIGQPRPIAFFVLTPIMGLVIAYAILSKRWSNKSWVLVLSILLYAVLLRWSIFNVYPDNFLGSDPQELHKWYESIAQGNSLDAANRGYQNTPVSIYLVAGLIKLGLVTKWAMILSIGLLEVASLIFTYLLGKRLFNIRIGLLAMLILATDNLHVMWGWWIVAQTLGVALFVVLLYLVVSNKLSIWRVILACLVCVAIVFSHTLTTFVSLLTVGILGLGYILYTLRMMNWKKLFRFSVVTVAFAFLLLVVSYWGVTGMFASYLHVWLHPGDMIVVSGTVLNEVTFAASASASAILPLLVELNRVNYYLFYGLTIVGVLAIWNTGRERFILVFASMVLASVIFYYLFIGEAPIFVDRWFVFLNIILAIPCSVGIYRLSASSRWRLLTYGIIVLLFLSFSITSATAFDSPLYRQITMPPNWLSR